MKGPSDPRAVSMAIGLGPFASLLRPLESVGASPFRFSRVRLDVDAGKPEVRDCRPVSEPPGSLGITTRLVEPLGRILAVSRDASVVFAGPLTHRGPVLRVHAEVPRAGGRLERKVERRGWIEDLPAL